VQVFLPERDFYEAAAVLDQKRLVKQLLEGRQIMNILVGQNTTKGWVNHPAVRMFRGHHSALYVYLAAIRYEMHIRGYKWEKNWFEIERMMKNNMQPFSLPKWMHDEYTVNSVVTTHRGRLYEKAPELYPQYRLEYEEYKDYVCCDKCTYHWPTHRIEWGLEGD
jgi:hypothetical protein